MKQETKILHVGRSPAKNAGAVNVPVYHASTIIFDNLADLDAAHARKYPAITYGRRGTPTTFALEQAVAELEGGFGAILAPSGMNAICTALTAFVSAGDHVLMIDSVYGPSRSYATGLLAKFGVETTFFDPLIGHEITELIQPNTRVLFLESPGSLTFEMPRLAMLAEIGKSHDLCVMIDNTWATPLYLKPFDLGIDISLHAGTKYIVGHSDAMVGVATAKDSRTFELLRKTSGDLGIHLAPDDAYLASRGIRTMAVRMPVHMNNGIELADWLQSRSEVVRVMHPALSSDPGHAMWQKDFTGASGLFSVVLRPAPRDSLAALVDHLELFGMGFSWGGYESLILPSSPPRTVRKYDQSEGWLVRIHAGLDHIDDLKNDLAAGLKRYAS